MKTVILRSLPVSLDRTIRRRAKEQRISVDEAVISLLEEHINTSEVKTKSLRHDLDAFAGRSTKQEAASFDKILAKQRRIAAK